MIDDSKYLRYMGISQTTAELLQCFCRRGLAQDPLGCLPSESTTKGTRPFKKGIRQPRNILMENHRVHETS